MGLERQDKTTVISQFELHAGDTGSPEVQIALLTKRIEMLSEHFKTHLKDHSSRRGLLKMVGRRKRLLRYLMQNHFDRYSKVIKDLGLRK